MNWKVTAAWLGVFSFTGGLIAGAWALDDRIRSVAREELEPMKEDIQEIKQDVRTIRDVILIRNIEVPH